MHLLLCLCLSIWACHLCFFYSPNMNFSWIYRSVRMYISAYTEYFFSESSVLVLAVIFLHHDHWPWPDPSGSSLKLMQVNWEYVHVCISSGLHVYIIRCNVYHISSVKSGFSFCIIVSKHCCFYVSTEPAEETVNAVTEEEPGENFGSTSLIVNVPPQPPKDFSEC